MNVSKIGVLAAGIALLRRTLSTAILFVLLSLYFLSDIDKFKAIALSVVFKARHINRKDYRPINVNRSGVLIRLLHNERIRDLIALLASLLTLVLRAFSRVLFGLR